VLYGEEEWRTPPNPREDGLYSDTVRNGFKHLSAGSTTLGPALAPLAWAPGYGTRSISLNQLSDSTIYAGLRGPSCRAATCTAPMQAPSRLTRRQYAAIFALTPTFLWLSC
jgi:hypothetical protein